ncbi:MAG: hypothetical protein AB7R67_05470 [Vicinamibacterales bacterium]
MSPGGPHGPIDGHAYCRAVEAHLCRQNGGHLIRIVGPAFDLVTGWAMTGIPLAVACAGIDRAVARAARRPGRHRPMRVEFCAADVLDAYDEWARAVSSAGIPTARAAAPPAAHRKPTLGQHIDRVVTQLTTLRGSGRVPAAMDGALAAAIAALDVRRAAAATARGPARETLIAELAAIEAGLTAAALDAVDAAARAEARRDAEAEIAAYRARLAPAQWDAAAATATARLVRLRLGLPQVAFE